MMDKNRIAGRGLCLALVALTVLTPAVAAAQTLEAQVEALEPYIGGFPPKLPSKEEKVKVSGLYAATLSNLNQALEAKPGDTLLLFERGRLQAMGYNMDAPKAFEGAEADLQAVIKAQPGNVAALSELGRLYVNSYPQLAARAEQLFLRAQAAQGAVPLEDAQFGLFFAYYYQGQMGKALAQSEFLVAHWPGNSEYRRLHDMVVQVKSRAAKKG
jgi:tetratricopeptide (TPR) repeat protein